VTLLRSGIGSRLAIGLACAFAVAGSSLPATTAVSPTCEVYAQGACKTKVAYHVPYNLELPSLKFDEFYCPPDYQYLSNGAIPAGFLNGAGIHVEREDGWLTYTAKNTVKGSTPEREGGLVAYGMSRGSGTSNNATNHLHGTSRWIDLTFHCTSKISDAEFTEDSL
jgi:hypothetical protein